MSQQWNVLVVTKHKLFGESIAYNLQKAGLPADSVDCNQHQLSEYLARTRPCTVLLEVASCDEETFALNETANLFPDVRTLILGQDESEATVVKYLEAGARGYITEGSSFSQITNAIQRVIAGEVVSNGKSTALIFGRLAELGQKVRHLHQFESDVLSFREREILELMAAGFTNQQIGIKLSISSHTVKNHVHNILGKLKVNGRLQAVRQAYEKRWLKFGPQAFDS